MELAKGGEVFDKLIEYGSLSEPEAAKLLAQVIFMWPVPTSSTLKFCQIID